jgi:hypothetical protein
MNIERYLNLPIDDRLDFIKPYLDKIINILNNYHNLPIKNKMIAVLDNESFELESDFIEIKLKEILNYPILNKFTNISFFKNENYWGVNTININNNFTYNNKITNIVLVINKYPLFNLIYEHSSNNIYIGVRLLGCYLSENFDLNIEKVKWELEKNDKLLVLNKDIGLINDKNNNKLNNFINYFLDDHIELVNDDYFCLIKEFIINKCELGLIVSQLFIVELLSYYNILKSLGYHIVNEDNLSINFDDLNIIYDFLIVKN